MLDGKLRTRLRTLIDESQATSPDLRAIGAPYGGLLRVYADAGGMLLVDECGRVFSLEHGSGEATPELDERWQRRALAFAARKFPELAPLLPARTPKAIVCRDCNGSGSAISAILCASCDGLGWLDGP